MEKKKGKKWNGRERKERGGNHGETKGKRKESEVLATKEKVIKGR